MKPSPGFECSYSGLWSWDCSFWEPVRRAEDIGLTLVLGSASPKIDNRPPLSWNLSTILIHNRGHLVRLGVLERFQLRGGLLSIFGGGLTLRLG